MHTAFLSDTTILLGEADRAAGVRLGRLLTSLGAVVFGPHATVAGVAATVGSASSSLRRVAVLDADAEPGPVSDLVERLRARRIPCLLRSTVSRGGGHAIDQIDAPVLPRTADPRQLATVVCALATADALVVARRPPIRQARCSLVR